MSRQVGVAWALVAVTFAAAVGRIVVSSDGLPVYLLTQAPAALAFAVLGAVVVARREPRAIGWLMIAAGAGTALYELASATAYQGLVVAPGSLPAATWAAWIAAWVWIPGFNAGFLLLPLLFPDGRPPSPRWRPLVALVLVLIVTELLAQALRPGPLTITDPVHGADIEVAATPLGVPGAAGVVRAFEVLVNVGFFPLLIALAAAVTVRYRRGNVVERYQLRWFLLAVALLPVAFALSAAGEGNPLAQAVAGLVLLGVPLSIGVAVLRYRLYEIDRIISRTVTYALVTALLAAVYAVVAVLPAAVLRVDSDLLVAAATLAAAAAFGPVRRRVQAVVDRRFNRARYDAVHVVEQFGGRLRRDLDLDSLIGDLHRTLMATVQPTSLTLWSAPRQAAPRQAVPSGASATPRNPHRNAVHNDPRTPQWFTGREEAGP